MSLTITKIGDSGYDYAGTQPFGIFSITGDTSYPAGGYSLSGLANFGLTKNLAGIFQLGSNNIQTGAALFWNQNTGKLQILAASDAVGSSVTEGVISGTATTSACTAANLVTVNAPNTLTAGQFVVIQGSTNGNIAKANGMVVQLVSATASAFTFTFAGIGGAVVSGADTGITAQQLSTAAGPVVGGTPSATISNSVLTTNVGTITVANSFVPGQMVALSGMVNGATLNGYVVQVLTASATQFTFYLTLSNISTGAETTGVATPLVAPSNLPIVANLGAIPLISNGSSGNTVIAANVATFTTIQNLNANNYVYVANMTNANGTPCKGFTVAVLSTSLTNTAFKFNFGPTASLTSAADNGVVVPLVVGSLTNSNTGSEIPAGTNISTYTWYAMVMGLR